MSPVKVTLTPSKEGDQEPQEQIVTLESEGEGQDEETEKHPQLWEKCLMMTEQPEDYDSDEDPEYVPPAVIFETDLEYDEVGLTFEIFDIIKYCSSCWTVRTTRFPTMRWSN